MDRSDIGYPQLVLAVLVVVTAIGLVVAASTSGAAFGSYNTGWNGASDLREEAHSVGTESEVIRNASRYPSGSPNGSLVMVLSPTTDYSPAETDRVRSFVRNGGTLLVADDFGTHSNRLLGRIGARARISGRLVRDERYHYRSPAFPVARNVSNRTLTRGVGSLTLNHGSSIRPNGAEVLVSTSSVAYIDSDGNAKLDDRDRVGTYPVATVESVGDGRVVVVGDPSIFINTMLARPDNRAFVRSLFESRDRVMLDYSHAPRLPPVAVALLVIRDAPPLQLLVGVLCVGVVGVWVRRPGVVARLDGLITPTEGFDPNPDAADLSSFVRKRHPDWDDDRVTRVIRGIMNRRDE